MRIAVNTRLLLPGKMDGIGWFTSETMRRIADAHPEHEFYFFFDRQPSRELEFSANVKCLSLCPQARHPILWRLFFDVSVRLALRHYRIDLFVSPDGMMPHHPPVPTLTVIHDLNFEHFDGNIKPSHQRFMRHHFPRYASEATRVATVSEYSRGDIAQTYGIDEGKIDVVYNGSHHNYTPLDEGEKAKVRGRWTQGNPYVIFVSTILKRKNLANLLLAFDRVKATEQGRGLKLVVVGQRAWWADELADAYENLRHQADVIFAGRAEPADLSSLLAAAEMLVYPSFFEGFGIPILEAMYADTPVVASHTTSMPEVGGEAARYIDPANVDDIAQAIVEVLDPAVRQQMVARGRVQRQRFSWERSANLLWRSMLQTIDTQ